MVVCPMPFEAFEPVNAGASPGSVLLTCRFLLHAGSGSAALQLDFLKMRCGFQKQKELSPIVHIIADLHLGASVDKPMQVFGPEWENHTQTIKRKWLETVSPGDTVFLPGDFSWGIDLEETLADFLFLEQLPGKKILSKGNHDYWWTTVSKMQQFLLQHGISSIDFLHNNAFAVEGMIVCGAKGYQWDAQESAAQNEKLTNREAIRLELSLKKGVSLQKKLPGYERAELVALLHYPPVTAGQKSGRFLELFQQYGVRRCFYGHIHGPATAAALTGWHQGVEFSLVSADFLSFCPQKLNKTVSF